MIAVGDNLFGIQSIINVYRFNVCSVGIVIGDQWFLFSFSHIEFYLNVLLRKKKSKFPVYVH